MSVEIVLLIVAGALVVVLGAGAGAAWLALFPRLPYDLGGAPDLDRHASRLRIPVGDGDAVDGWFLCGRERSVVLVLHGYGRNHTRAWRYGSFLHRAGHSVLTIDFRSSRGRGTGRRKPTTLGHHEVPDAEAALDWILRRPELAGHRIAVFGESLGGAVALMLAGRRPEVAAVIVDGAFACGASAIEDSSSRWARLPRQPTARIARVFGRVVTGFDPGAVDACRDTALLRDRPVFFVHGMRDNRLSPDQVVRLWRAAGAKDPLWLVPDAGHNQAWRLHRTEYEQRVLAFLGRHLADRDENRALA